MRLLLLLISTLYLSATIESVDITPKDSNHEIGSIKILDQKLLELQPIDGIPFGEASDMAYDRAKSILYMVGDSGDFYTFHLTISSKIDSLKPKYAYKLRDSDTKIFGSKYSDAEGMTLSKDGYPIISFERRPKIGLFRDGIMKKSYHLPRELQSINSYKSPNKSLESLVLHPKYGLLTVSEYPIGKRARTDQTIYSLSGQRWHFTAESDPNSAVTAIEVMDDGNILVLERAYVDMLSPLVITLKKIYLDRVVDGKCHTEIVAKMSSADGWQVDNFEGLTRVAPHRYLMISDDNYNPLQRTLLIYFEIK